MRDGVGPCVGVCAVGEKSGAGNLSREVMRFSPGACDSSWFFFVYRGSCKELFTVLLSRPLRFSSPEVHG